MEGTAWAIVVAAGDGRRFGRAKQFDRIGSRRVLDWSVEAAAVHVQGVVVVLPSSELADPVVKRPDVRVVCGGPTRAASVRAGLALVPTDAATVVVHDAARPLATSDLFAAVLAAVRAGSDAAVPGLVLPDTLKRVEGGWVVATIDRDEVVAVQTPQAFSAEVLRAAHVGEPEATDDAALVERIGGRVAVVPGEVRNLKITSPEDLVTAAQWLLR